MWLKICSRYFHVCVYVCVTLVGRPRALPLFSATTLPLYSSLTVVFSFSVFVNSSTSASHFWNFFPPPHSCQLSFSNRHFNSVFILLVSFLSLPTFPIPFLHLSLIGYLTPLGSLTYLSCFVSSSPTCPFFLQSVSSSFPFPLHLSFIFSVFLSDLSSPSIC